MERANRETWSDTRDVGKPCHDVALESSDRAVTAHVGKNDVLPRCAGERARLEDDEEVRLESRPVHLAQTRDACRHLHSLHVPGDGIMDADVEIVRDSDVERDFG